MKTLTRFTQLFVLLALVAALAGTPAPAQATGGAYTIVSNLPTTVMGGAGNNSSGGTVYCAIQFTMPATAYDVNTATLGVDYVGAGTSVGLSIQADNAGAPSGTALATFTAPSVPSAIYDGNLTLYMATPYTLAASTTYWLVASPPPSQDWMWNYTSDANQIIDPASVATIVGSSQYYK